MVKRTTLDADYAYKQGQQSSPRQSQQTRVNRLRLFVVLPLLILSFFFLINSVRIYLDIQHTKQQINEQQVAIDKLKKQQQQYQAVIDSLNSEEFIEKLARQQYLLSNKGEIIFKLPHDENIINDMINSTNN